MPQFYLHQQRDGRLIEDPEGSDLRDLSAAREEALAAARDMWGEAIADGEDISDRAFVIADEHGERHLTVPFTDALPEALRRRLRPGGGADE